MTFEALKEVFVEVLDCEEDAVVLTASLQDDLKMDSLDAVELNMAIEDAAGVSIPDEELGSVKTVADVFNYVKDAE